MDLRLCHLTVNSYRSDHRHLLDISAIRRCLGRFFFSIFTYLLKSWWSWMNGWILGAHWCTGTRPCNRPLIISISILRRSFACFQFSATKFINRTIDIFLRFRQTRDRRFIPKTSLRFDSLPFKYDYIYYHWNHIKFLIEIFTGQSRSRARGGDGFAARRLLCQSFHIQACRAAGVMTSSRNFYSTQRKV